MTAWFLTTTGLWVALGLLALAAVVAVVVLALPGNPKIPIERRRPDGSTPSALERAAAASTGTIERWLAGHEGGAATLLERAGVKQPLQNLVIIVGSAMLAAAALGLLWGGWIAAIVLALAVPLLFRLGLGLKTSRREAAFADQLDETLQIMAGSLRAGYSLPQTLSTVALESEEPTSTEFARVVNESRVGRDLDFALDAAAQRTHNEDFFWITQAISINREVGGNLADVLDGVGETIRQRSQLRRQVKALSAEGKLSAIILGVLPFALFGFIWLTNRSYVELLFTTFPGVVMLVIGLILIVVGIFWLSRTIKIKY